MNNTLEFIKSRRSTRVFEINQLKKTEIDTILEAGMWAPSGHNMQSWHFTVVQNHELLKEINYKAKEVFKNMNIEDKTINNMVNNEKFNMFYDAPTVIFVSGDKNALTPVVDTSAAVQNMLLMAHSMNLGSCWLHMPLPAFSGEEGRLMCDKLGIPKNYEVMHAISFGYKKTEGGNGPKRKENTVNYVK